MDSIGALNGMGYAAMACDPDFRQALADHGYTLDPETGEVTQLAAYAGRFSARSAQIGRNIDRYEARWRSEHPGEEPGKVLREVWDRRAWADARPDKVVPTNGAELNRRWVEQLTELGFTPPVRPAGPSRPGTTPGRIDRDAAADLALSRLSARRSAWNSADIRGEVERIVTGADLVAPPAVRRELTEDLTARAVSYCVPLLDRTDVPAHVRALTSRRVLDVEKDVVDRLAHRAEQPPGRPRYVRTTAETADALRRLDPDQRRAATALLHNRGLVVVEGAAGAGKTSTLAATRLLLESQDRRLIIVTPTLKAARVAQDQTGAPAFSAAWFAHQHGFRWDGDGHWDRVRAQSSSEAILLPGDVLLVDEAGMLDQDTARRCSRCCCSGAPRRLVSCTRTERLHRFADRCHVEECLHRMASRPQPLMCELE